MLKYFRRGATFIQGGTSIPESRVYNFLASLEYDLGFIPFYFTIGYMFGERFTEFVL